MTQNRSHDKKPYQKSCRTCKTKFSPYRTMDNFCSFECRKQFDKIKQSTHSRDQQQTKRQHEKRKLSEDEKTYLTQREKLRIQAIENGNYFCQKCGVSQKSLECHHIVWRSEIPRHELKHNLMNLIFLCVECHKWYHEKKGNRNELVEERQLYKLFGDKIRNK